MEQTTATASIELLNEIIQDYIKKRKPYGLHWELVHKNMKIKSEMVKELESQADTAIREKLKELDWSPQKQLSEICLSTDENEFSLSGGAFSVDLKVEIPLPEEALAIHNEYKGKIEEVRKEYSTEKDSVHFLEAAKIYEASPHKESNVHTCLDRSFAAYIIGSMKKYLETGATLYVVDNENPQTKHQIIEASGRYAGMGETDWTIKWVNTDTDQHDTVSVYKISSKFGNAQQKYTFTAK